MAVISITIEESEQQLISGLPKYLTISTSSPATIFYTFDGIDPTTSSDILTSSTLSLPTQKSVTVKLFATNGVDSSSIISQFYYTDLSAVRKSHNRVTTDDGSENFFPYGTDGPELPAAWGTFAPSTSIVDSPNIDNVFDGYDGAGGTTSGLDLDLSEYEILFSERNHRGERGRGIGTLPVNITVQAQEAPPVFSDRNKAMFNPRALVIYQDSREEPFDPEMCQINRPFFSLVNPEKYKDGILFNTTGFEGNAPTGAFLRQFFNPRDNTITYYYFDSQSLRWIISKEPYTPTPAQNKGLSNIVFTGRGPGAAKVFKSIPFRGTRLP